MTLNLIAFNAGGGMGYDSLQRLDEFGNITNINEFSLLGVNQLLNSNTHAIKSKTKPSNSPKSGGSIKRKISRRKSSIGKRKSSKKSVTFKFGGGIKPKVKIVPKSAYKAAQRYSSLKTKQDMNSADRSRIEKELDRILR